MRSSASWFAAALTVGFFAKLFGQPERTRAEHLAELAAAESTLARGGADGDTRLRHARLVHQSGDFWRARELAVALAESPTASVDVIELAAKLEFMTGGHDAAERLYDRLIAAQAGNVAKQVMAKVGKLFVLNQRNRFDQINQLGFPTGVQLPNATLARAFQSNPYRVEWRQSTRIVEVPFLATDPLPQFAIEVDGVPMNVLFDTGGDLLIIDDEVAKQIGVTVVAKATGTFGGGLKSEIGFGKVGRVTVGGVVIHDVPAMILATRRFTFDPKIPLSGIFGTALIRQFLGTLDYRDAKLILRERTPESTRAVRVSLADRLAAEVPFVLDATHIMLARGSLNQKDLLTFWIDSGFATDAAFTAPIQTLRYLDIPVPERRMPDSGVGGGGGKWASGFYSISSLGLGGLRQTNLRGEYGARGPESYWEHGYLVDGLISHRFFRQYGSWTLDFDSMTYLFER